ncbi:MAG: hypothetical protein LBF08_00255 [Dysgonamonadaceae bacterium]|nr:hypothetical protein [Dysgonamonadaceae bacterium]
MKKNIKTRFAAILTAGLLIFASCADMLDTTDNAYLNTDNNRLNSANDSLYSVAGILKLLQPLGERYILLGELRGDLTETTENADMDMQAIADFTATAENPYLSKREYYAVINNCNYFLRRVDTTIISSGRKVMLGEYAAVKAIRAWTYLQLGLNFGKAVWLTKPLLNIDDMNGDYAELQSETLIDTLIADITPYLNTDFPSYGEIGNFSASYLLIPVPVLLADLFLWQGAYTGNAFAYARAAQLYYQWFTAQGRTFAPTLFRNTYATADFSSVSTSWQNMYAGLNAAEHVGVISYNPSFVENPTVYQTAIWCFPSNNETYMIKPSQAAIHLWQNETYAFYRETQKDVLYVKGDLRGAHANFQTGSYAYTPINDADSVPYIIKYGYYMPDGMGAVFFPSMIIYRTGLLCLRYAEALNALGKPSLAFAVLKYGMKPETLADAAKVSPDEINPLPPYCDFTNERFSVPFNRGLHARGSGDAEYDTVYYAFTPQALSENRAYYGLPEKLETRQDSMAFVNVMICKELALETAFEGNRFHDLMRLSKQHERLAGKGDFLAKWVGRRKPALESRLAAGNWIMIND